MKRHTVRASACCLFLFFAGGPFAGAEETTVTSPAETPAALVEKLAQCLEKEAAAPVPPESDASPDAQRSYSAAAARHSQTSAMLRYVRMIPAQIESGNAPETLQMLTQQFAAIPLGPDCAELLQSLTAALGRAEEERQAVLENKVTALMKQTGQTLLDAKAPADLDASLRQIAAMNADMSQRRYRNNSSSNTLNNLTQIVTGWQDYLAYLAAGDRQQAANNMESIGRSVATTPVVPRSAVLQRLLALKGLQSGEESGSGPGFTVDSVIAEIHAPDDLAGAKEKLRALAELKDSRMEAHPQLQAVESLLSVREQIESGNPRSAIAAMRRRTFQNQTAWAEEIESQLAQRALLLTLPEAERPATAPQSLEKLVTSTATRLAASEDWLSLWEMLQVAGLVLDPNSGSQSQVVPSLRNDVQAIEKFIHARRLEDAGKLADALDQYLAVLALTGKYGPYAAANAAVTRLRGERSADLLADQKREAEQPQATVRMPASRFPTGYPGRMDSREISVIVNGIVDAKIATALAAEEKKVKKETPGKEALPPEKPVEP